MAIPAICAVCGRDDADGDWVRFRDFEPLVQPPGARPEEIVIGDDRGKAYCCASHLAAARERAGMPLADALAALHASSACAPADLAQAVPVRGPRRWIASWSGRGAGTAR